MIVWGGARGYEVNSLGVYYPKGSYEIGGNLSNLNGNQIVLQNNGGDDLTLITNGSFTFPKAIFENGSYDVTVLTNPLTPSQTCTVSNGSATNIAADVVDVSVTCVDNVSYYINVTVNGLDATNSIELTTNGQSLNFATAGGPTNFTTPIDVGTAYAVMLTNQPTSPNQICSVSGGDNNDGSGTIVDADVSILVNCITIQYDVNIVLTGLATSNEVSFSNGTDTLSLNVNTTSAISRLDDGTAYAVSITSQPITPNQTCEFDNASSGILAGENANINVSCTINQYFIGGMTSGFVTGNPVTLKLDAQNLNVATTTFIFVHPLGDESHYNATIIAEPLSPSQSCTLFNGSGQIAGEDITDLEVHCNTNQYTIGGTVFGLLTSNSLVIQNNLSNDLNINANGNFVFSTALDDLGGYNVTIETPAINPIQPCTITNNNGNLAGNDINNVIITCEFGTDLIFRNSFEPLGP
jgi:hypothetical protein